MENDDETIKFTVYNVAQQYVLQLLKSPSTAEFPDATTKLTHIVKLSKGQYRINSWVDCQNDFGAPVRSRFSIKVTIQGEKAVCSDFSFNK